MLLLRQTILPMYFFIDKYRYTCSFHWQMQVSRYCLSKDLCIGVVIAFWWRSQFLWDHWAHPGYCENWIPKAGYLGVRGRGGGGGRRGRGQVGVGVYAASQTTALPMKRFNQTESPILVILCVLCSQRQSVSAFIPLSSAAFMEQSPS